MCCTHRLEVFWTAIPLFPNNIQAYIWIESGNHRKAIKDKATKTMTQLTVRPFHPFTEIFSKTNDRQTEFFSNDG